LPDSLKNDRGVAESNEEAVRLAAGITLPTLSNAIVVPWTAAIARSRGIYSFDSIDPRSRNFNLMRARILEIRQRHGWRLLGVVSATPNVGKSFIAANLAASLSRSPKYQTYAVDFDLRRGSLTSLFGVNPDIGILDYFERRTDQTPPGFAFESERLIVLPTTQGSTHSAELLAGDRAQALLRAARTADDSTLFIFDLPPVFANDDASIAMSRLDGYILVAEEGKTKQRELTDVTSLLGTERLAGVVLNKYRGGLVSEGYGVDEYFSSGYGSLD
jgi:protein-tyrosine kinase